MATLIIDFPKCGLRMKLLQIGPAKKGFQCWKKFKTCLHKRIKRKKGTWTEA